MYTKVYASRACILRFMNKRRTCIGYATSWQLRGLWYVQKRISFAVEKSCALQVGEVSHYYILF